MRLWHEALIPYLPRQQLLGQHRECCALRGKGWGKKHATVNYVFEHDKSYLIAYHFMVMCEMKKRGYSAEEEWKNPCYCGKSLECSEEELYEYDIRNGLRQRKYHVFPEHNETYLKECLDNLEAKGIHIEL